MNKVGRIGYYIIFVLAAQVVRGQEILLKGRVVNEDSIAVPFASIQMMKKNIAVASKISGEDGHFELMVDSAGQYQILITQAAYNDHTGSVQIDANPAPMLFMLTQRNDTLTGVTVTARRRQLITRKIDRVVMDVENNPLAAGRSSSELLELAPGVFVQDGKISINGNPGTRIMVNGKILQISGDDLISYLNTLRAEEIQSVEIIPRPPAEYDAAGSGGYINIVLKQQKTAGFNGSINTGYTQGRYVGANTGAQKLSKII